MKTQSVNFGFMTRTAPLCAKKPELPTPAQSPIKKQMVYAKHLNFRGEVPLGNLINDYKWFVNADKTPAIDAFLKLDAPKESLQSLLRVILRDDNTSSEFVDSIVKQPRNITKIYNKLRNKLPENSDILNFYGDNNPYKIAYEKYLDKKVESAKSLSELLAIRPDWKEEVLISKHRALSHNDDLKIGKVPDEIGADFENIINYLRRYVTYGSKSSKEIPDLNLNNKTYKFHYNTDGKSDKNVFKIELPTGKNYILKIAPIESRGLDSEFGMGTTCKIDAYLTANHCRNSAPLKYYDHGENVSIYDYIEPNPVPDRIRYDLSDFDKKMPDFKDLGLSQSDTVGANNYFALGHNQECMRNSYDVEYGINNGEYVSVDNDHVTYSQILSPMINKYFKHLPQSVGAMFF